VTLASLLFTDDRDPDAPAVHASGEMTTVGELQARADAIAAELRQAEVGVGAAVAVRLPNTAELIATLFGVWRAGGVYVPINPRLTQTEVDRTFDAVRPAAIVTDDGVSAGVDEPAHHTPDIALIQFTSGTTGRPKPVLLRHDGVLVILDGVIGTVRGGSSGAATGAAKKAPMPNLVPVSLSVWAGIYQVLFAFRVGAPVVLMDQFETGEFARLVREFGIRSTVLPPAAMTMLCDDDAIRDLSPLRYVRSISSPLSPLQARRFHDQFGIAVMNGWGQTEIGGEIVGWSGADTKEWGETKLGSVGRPHRDVTVRAVDESGSTLSAGEPGELWVMTPALSAGYADGNDLGDRLSDDGWFRTGDIGRVDEDGFVWIEGRVSDVINRGGLKVYPDEVAEVLRLSPAVLDAAVVGVRDERLGEVPWAFLVASDGGSVPSDRELEVLAREHLAPYKVPVRYVTVDELPRNDVGKVVKSDLLAADAEGSAEPGDGTVAEEPHRRQG
jgi:acyl-CoA synthetase (AMP-forming)/AMP-acid ligase II